MVPSIAIHYRSFYLKQVYVPALIKYLYRIIAAFYQPVKSFSPHRLYI